MGFRAGGGVAESDLFYEACDRAGVLVYQEFWMTGDNNGRWAGSYDWPDDFAAYEAAADDTILRLRRFASLLWYGGGNELYPRSKSPPPRVWASIEASLARHDPTKLRLPSTMDGGTLGGNESLHDSAYALVAKDGPYDALDPATWAERNPGLNRTEFPGLEISLMPEVGSASLPANRAALAKFLPEAELRIPTETLTSGWRVHRFESFKTAGAAYDAIGAYGSAASLDDWLAFASLAQYQQYQLLFESYAAHCFEWYEGPASEPRETAGETKVLEP